MIFHWVPTTTGIANSSHSYGLMSWKLQNSGHCSPLEWYFNGVLTLPILQIPMALYFQNSGCHSPLKWYFIGVLALLIRNIPMGFWVQCCQIPATSPLEWYFNGDQTLALPILNIPMALRFQNSGHHSPLEWYFKTLAFPILHISMASWVQSCKIPATVAHWNDISLGFNHCHYQLFTFL